ncbi:MAG: ABC transporter permease [Vicinamibacterales bacterium]|nr:ABC transporter permease [Vicinamibacterales bacterium]
MKALRDLRDAVRQAAWSVLGNPLRAGLGALAIAVAVATVVVVVTAIDGVGRYATTIGARAFGSDTFLVAQIASAGQINRRELADKQQRNPPVRRNDLRYLERIAGDGITYASTVQRVAGVTAAGLTVENASIVGATATLVDLRDLGIGRGRFLQRAEELRGAQVAVIGADVAATLFPARDPLGAHVRVAGRRFEVVGVQQRLGSSGGTSLDRSVYIPITAFERAFGPPPSLSVFARPVGGGDTEAAEDTARMAMRARRQLAPGVADTFDILTPRAARSFVQSLSQRIGAAAGPLSAMALLAAIVVVTNTMLVSVTQKTREIGVRRAIGASQGQIMREVVAESLLVSTAGGLAGTLLTSLALSALASLLEIDIVVRTATMAWAMGAAALSGLVAGYYPARRATRIDVIAAVRAE